jgi:hypothetical protein
METKVILKTLREQLADITLTIAAFERLQALRNHTNQRASRQAAAAKRAVPKGK